MSINEGVDKEDMAYIYIYIMKFIFNIVYNIMVFIYTYNGILLSHQKELNNAICSNIDDLEIVILSEVNCTEQEISYDIP